MSSLSASDQEKNTLALVWPRLSSDLQIRVVGLLAQLALNVVVARQKNQSEGEESYHAKHATDAQNPS